MANIFSIPGSQYRTQEEENFKGVPRSGEQTYFLPDFIGDVGTGFKEMVSEESTNALQNYNVSQNLNLPTSANINSMGEQELIQLKNKLEFQKKHSVSNQFGNSFDMTLQQINEALNNLSLNNNIVPVSYNGIEQGSTDMDNPNPDSSGLTNDTNIATVTEEDEIANANKMIVNSTENINHDLELWNQLGTELDSLNENAAANGSPELKDTLQNNVAVDGVFDEITENKMLVEDGNKFSSDSSKETFNKSKGELELEASASETEVTKEGTKTAVEKIKEELLKVMPEQELPKELLMMKFGANLLRAKSNRRGTLPKFLDELGQALEPVTDTLIAFDMKRQEQDRALALQAYGIYEAQQERGAKDYEFEDIWNVYANDYSPEGAHRGYNKFMGQISTPAEFGMFSSMRYPSEDSVKAGLHTQEELVETPQNLRGQPIFIVNKTTGAKVDVGPTSYHGFLSDNPSATYQNDTEMMRLKEMTLNDAQYLQIVGMGMLPENKQVAGVGGKLEYWKQAGAAQLNSFAKFLGKEDGIPKLSEWSGEKDYEEFFNALKAEGVDISPAGLRAGMMDDVQAMIQLNNDKLNQGLIGNDLHALNEASIAKLQNIADKMRGTDARNVLYALVQKSAFGRARYLQGSNRLLKDVIRESLEIMDAYKGGGMRIRTILQNNIDDYIVAYNDKLKGRFDPTLDKEMYENSMLTRDLNYNISGGFLSSNPEGNISSQNPAFGDPANFQDPNFSQELGGQQETISLEQMFDDFALELPGVLK